jgi:hypothetical protein
VIKFNLDVFDIGWGAPPTSKPVKVALVMNVVCAVVTKSSAVSLSSLPALAVRERVAIKPSGPLVLKENGSAAAGATSSAAVATMRVAKLMTGFIGSS